MTVTPPRLHRSELAVPGSNVRMLEKAPRLGADIVILDLEDAVAPADKPQARLNIVHALCEGDWDFWRDTSIEQAEDRGHHELLNWFALAGALHALGIRKPKHAVFLESWISNSDKVFAVFPPSGESRGRLAS